MNPPVRRLADWNGADLRALADEHGAPLYVLDLDRVRQNYRRLAAAFPDAEVLYAAKANALGDVLETLLDEGAGIECASAGEVDRALAAGADGSRVHYTAVNPPAADLDSVVEAWREHPELTVVAGSADTIDRLEERGYDGRLCLRVNPGIGAGHHEKVRTGADAKFGVPADRAADLLASTADRGFDVVGIHAHVGSGVSGDDLDAHRAFVARMGELAREVSEALRGTDDDGLEFVDVGGGFGVPYREDEDPLDLATVAEATREAVGAAARTAESRTENEVNREVGEVPRTSKNRAGSEATRDLDTRLTIEPGRYLVADAGVLLTRVNTVKEAPETTVVGVDAGMTTLLRPAMYDAYHPVRNVASDAGARDAVEQTVTGPICESSDVFCEDRSLPVAERGDLLALGNAGAYGYEMANQYNSRPRPASVVVADGDARLARRRETFEDVARPEREARATDVGSRSDGEQIDDDSRKEEQRREAYR